MPPRGENREAPLPADPKIARRRVRRTTPGTTRCPCCRKSFDFGQTPPGFRVSRAGGVRSRSRAGRPRPACSGALGEGQSRRTRGANPPGMQPIRGRRHAPDLAVRHAPAARNAPPTGTSDKKSEHPFHAIHLQSSESTAHPGHPRRAAIGLPVMDVACSGRTVPAPERLDLLYLCATVAAVGRSHDASRAALARNEIQHAKVDDLAGGGGAPLIGAPAKRQGLAVSAACDGVVWRRALPPERRALDGTRAQREPIGRRHAHRGSAHSPAAEERRPERRDEERHREGRRRRHH
jgi:hypothetical protein